MAALSFLRVWFVFFRGCCEWNTLRPHPHFTINTPLWLNGFNTLRRLVLSLVQYNVPASYSFQVFFWRSLPLSIWPQFFGVCINKLRSDLASSRLLSSICGMLLFQCFRLASFPRAGRLNDVSAFQSLREYLPFLLLSGSLRDWATRFEWRQHQDTKTPLENRKQARLSCCWESQTVSEVLDLLKRHCELRMWTKIWLPLWALNPPTGCSTLLSAGG